MKGIYQITNIVDKQKTIYIGSTINLKRRWKEHCNKLRRDIHDNPHLQHAWNKYGENAFEYGVLEYLGNSEELHLAEQFWMDIYRLEGRKLYNCGLVARSPRLGRKHSEETKQKMSATGKGRIVTEETRQKLRDREYTKATRRKMSDGAKTRPPISEKTRQRLREVTGGRNNGMWGRHHTKETRQKIGKTKLKPYPVFIHRDTGEIIPAGIGLSIICRERNLHHSHMHEVAVGKVCSHKGWVLKKEE